MKTNPRKKRLALSPVISALILSASVLVVGGAVWNFSQNAMTIYSEHYAESVINMSETISERFIIEHVAYINDAPKVWIYNYGKVDIEIKIEVKTDVVSVTYPSDPETWIPMIAGGFEDVEFLGYPTVSGELVIKAYTRRGNSVYYNYIVP